MVAKWKHFRETQPHFLNSLMALNNVHKGVKIYAVSNKNNFYYLLLQTKKV